MDKQLGLSKRLKAICIVVGLVILAGWGGIIYLRMIYLSEDKTSFLWGSIILTGLIALLCLDVVLQFWKVCTEIGRDNSFSKENVVFFNHMKWDGILAIPVFCLQALLVFLNDQGYMLWYAAKLGMVIGAVIFIELCSALAKLIDNAYEMKHENDLTI